MQNKEINPQMVQNLIKTLANIEVMWQGDKETIRTLQEDLTQSKLTISSLETRITTLYLEIEHLRSEDYRREIESLRSELENLRGY